MDLRRPLHSTYEMLTQTKLLRAFKAPWATVAAVLWSLFRTDSNSFQTQFLSEACRPKASGGSPVVNLQPGLALVDVPGNGEWEGTVQPILLEQEQPIEFDTNTGNNTYIESIFIRPVLEEFDEEVRHLRDPSQNQDYKEKVAQGERLTWETTTVKGAESPNPSPPGLPNGDSSWIRIADVTRPVGTPNVQDADVNDKRTESRIQLDGITSRSLMQLWNGLRFEDSSQSNHLEFVADLTNRVLQLWDDQDTFAGPPSGSLELGNLIADALRTRGGDVMSLDDDSGNTGDGKLELSEARADSVRPRSGAVLRVDDSGGGNGDGELRLKGLRTNQADSRLVFSKETAPFQPGSAEVVSRTNLLAWAVLSWDDGNSRWVIDKQVNVAGFSANTSNSVALNLSNAPAFTTCLVKTDIQKLATPTDFLLSDGQAVDDGFGNLELNAQIQFVDVGADEVGPAGADTLSDGATLMVAAAYEF